MAMEYVPGLSVAQSGAVDAAARRRAAGVAAGVVAQACAGLHSAHEYKLPDGPRSNIIHRDVSPQNLILTFEGQLKVVDFGIAKAQGRARPPPRRHGEGQERRTWWPEQCLGLELDRRSVLGSRSAAFFRAGDSAPARASTAASASGHLVANVRQ